MNSFSIIPNKLPKSDPRYIKWKLSLKKRPVVWNKNKSKLSDKRVRQISETFKRKKLDNFREWREMMRREGKIISKYLMFTKNVELATLIGLVLGDGHIDIFPRTEKITISLGTDKPDLISYALILLVRVFRKEPTICYSKVARVAG